MLLERKEAKRIFTLVNVIQCRQALFCVVVLTVFNGATSEVGIATLYRLHGQGIESRFPVGGDEILHTRRPALGSIQPPIKGHRVLSGSKATGRDVDPIKRRG